MLTTPRRRTLLLLAGAAALYGCGDPPPDPYAAQKAALSWDTQQYMDTLARVFWVTVLLAVVGGLLLAGWWLMGRAWWNLRAAGRAVQLTQPGANGMLPFATDLLLADPHWAETAHRRSSRVSLAAAKASQAVPSSYTYHNAPVLSSLPDVPQLPPGEGADPGPLVPAFLELLDRGMLTQPDTLMGFTTEAQPLYLPTPVDLLIFGKKGSGKTTTARYGALLTVLRGGKLILCDPHMGANEESLATSLQDLAPCFVRPPAKAPGDVLANIRWLHAEMQRRLDGGRYDYDVMLLIDEIASMFNPAKEEWADVRGPIAGLLELINVEGRKVRVGVKGMSQQPNASRMGGGTELRTSFSSTLVHRLDSKQAAMLPFTTQERLVIGRLPKGAGFLLDDDGGATLIHVPNATRADAQEVVRRVVARDVRPPTIYPGLTPEVAARLLAAVNRSAPEAAEAAEGTEAPSAPIAETPRIPPPEAAEGAGSGEATKAATVRALLAARTPTSKIIEQVWGTTGGRRYTLAAAELTEILAQLVEATDG